jgi:hypothetical protein
MDMNRMKAGLRSVWAVLAGVLANFIIAMTLDMVLHYTQVFPNHITGTMETWHLLVAFAYRFVAAIIGGYLTAFFAPFDPMRHALVLGGVGVGLSTLGAIVSWSYGNHWYPISLISIALPCSYGGAQLHQRLQKEEKKEN